MLLFSLFLNTVFKLEFFIVLVLSCLYSVWTVNLWGIKDHSIGLQSVMWKQSAASSFLGGVATNQDHFSSKCESRSSTYIGCFLKSFSVNMKKKFKKNWRWPSRKINNWYRVFLKKVLHKREGKMQEKMKMT